MIHHLMIFHVCSKETKECSVLTESASPKNVPCDWILVGFCAERCNQHQYFKKILNLLMNPRTLIFPFLAINCCKACMNKSVSKLHEHSICTAMLVKHVKSFLYLLSSFLISFTRNGPNISTPQLVNVGSSKVL